VTNLLNRSEPATITQRLSLLAGGLVAFSVVAACGAADDAPLADDAHSADEPVTDTLAQATTAVPVSGWNPAECDEIYKIYAHAPNDNNAPFQVQAGREINTSVSIDAPWGDEEIQALAFKPFTDNAKVLHHWILNGSGGGFISGWAPGDDDRPPLPKDVGIEMPRGKRSMSFNLHYYNLQGTKAELDRSGVEVCALKKPHFRPKVAAVASGLVGMGNGFVLAPANAKNHAVTGTCKLAGNEPVHIITAAPHAHKYAVHMKFTAKRTTGETIVMHDEPFQFGEQGTYPIEGGEVVLNKGDVITTTCVYTNPTAKNITFGESTENEMCFNFARYYPKGSLRCGR
jgi:hypothetical protein